MLAVIFFLVSTMAFGQTIGTGPFTVAASTNLELIVSAMTSSNTPSPFIVSYVSAKNDYNAPTTNYWKWLDRNASTKVTVDHQAEGSIDGDSLKVYMGASKKAVSAYKLSNGNIFEMPCSWNLEGSDNDADWTLIHSVNTNQSFGTSSAMYSLTNTVSYDYVRMLVNTSGYYSQQFTIGELELYRTLPATAPVKTIGSTSSTGATVLQ